MPSGPQEWADKEEDEDLQPKNLLNAENTEKSVRAIRAAEIFISTSSEGADEATKLPTLPIIPLITKKSFSVINAIKHNIAAYVGGALT